MPLWDLTLHSNWSIILSQRELVSRVNDSALETRGGYRYTPIPPIFAAPLSSTLLIGTYSQTAKPYWFLGARASANLFVSPSSYAEFSIGVQVAQSKPIGLNRLNLVEFNTYGVSPYALQLEIPYWLEDIYVEVWEYIGEVGSAESRLAFIEQELTRIESRIDTDTITIN